jgi:hypothetical protein
VSCIEPPPRSSATPSDSVVVLTGGQIPVARLLVGGQDLDLEPAALDRTLEELRLVGRVADRRRRHGPDVVDAARGGEVGVDLERPQRPLHRLGLERARLLEPFADADALVDLVGALPPRALDPGEDDEAEGVRAQVDDRLAPFHGASYGWRSMSSMR